jgi:hypothetical protein
MGGGRRPGERRGPDEDDPWAVAERKSRAVEEPLDIRLTAREPFPRVEVVNPLHHTVYEVLLPTYPDEDIALCTCTDFARRGLGTCKHIEAVRRWLGRHPNAPVSGPLPPPWDGTAAWEEVDRRLATPAPPSLPASLAWRRAGAVLFERPAPSGVDEKEKTERVGRGDAAGAKPTPSRGRP